MATSSALHRISQIKLEFNRGHLKGGQMQLVNCKCPVLTKVGKKPHNHNFYILFLVLERSPIELCDFLFILNLNRWCSGVQHGERIGECEATYNVICMVEWSHTLANGAMELYQCVGRLASKQTAFAFAYLKSVWLQLNALINTNASPKQYRQLPAIFFSLPISVTDDRDARPISWCSRNFTENQIHVSNLQHSFEKQAHAHPCSLDAQNKAPKSAPSVRRHNWTYHIYGASNAIVVVLLALTAVTKWRAHTKQLSVSRICAIQWKKKQWKNAAPN